MYARLSNGNVIYFSSLMYNRYPQYDIITTGDLLFNPNGVATEVTYALSNGNYFICKSETISGTNKLNIYFYNPDDELIMTNNMVVGSAAWTYKVYLGYGYNYTTAENWCTIYGNTQAMDDGMYCYPGYREAGTEYDTFQEFFEHAIPGSFPGDTSGTGGGTGSFDDYSEPIDFPDVPTLSAVNAGFITLYAPSIAQLNSLASYMWSSSFDLDTFKKLFADPMDAIIGLSIVPVSVPISGSQEIKIGFVNTGVYMNLASSQYITVDCGSLSVEEFWGSALDYSPYTKFSIHLPYIGTRELNTDDVMSKTIQVKYNIDVLSGSCTSMIKCGNSVLYEFSGACAGSIPVTGQTWTQLLTSCIQLAGAGITAAASGGSAAGLLPSTANAVMAMKPNIQRTGTVSGAAGMLGLQTPYLIREIPQQSLANNYNTFVGYPSNITALLSTLTGYTQIESVHLENISATQTELAEIETLLKEGVII